MTTMENPLKHLRMMGGTRSTRTGVVGTGPIQTGVVPQLLHGMMKDLQMMGLVMGPVMDLQVVMDLKVMKPVMDLKVMKPVMEVQVMGPVIVGLVMGPVMELQVMELHMVVINVMDIVAVVAAMAMGKAMETKDGAEVAIVARARARARARACPVMDLATTWMEGLSPHPMESSMRHSTTSNIPVDSSWNDFCLVHGNYLEICCVLLQKNEIFGKHIRDIIDMFEFHVAQAFSLVTN